MNLDLALTFLELGNATSRNLAFSHRDDVWVSYGEETITETNLLEIRRRHPGLVRVRTFPKPLEAKNGADWEWHIVGERRTLSMRVQAKRVQRDCILKVRHKVKSSGRQQRRLLMAGAKAAGMKPVYCIYCTERQRTVWKEHEALPGYTSFQAGCLLADAAHVLPTTRRLKQIEKKCRPWHHLFLPAVLMGKELESFAIHAGEFVEFVSIRQPRVPLVQVGKAMESPNASGWNAPTVDDLNEDTDREFDPIGVHRTTPEDRARLELDTDSGIEVARMDEERLRDLGICRLLVMDVRDDPESDERRGHKRH